MNIRKLHLLVSALLLFFSVNAQDYPTGFWTGSLTYEKRFWDIGIELKKDNDRTHCSFYSEALWRWDFQLDSVQYLENEIVIQLPFDIGTLRAKLDKNQLVGMITIRNTSTAIPIILKPSILPELQKRNTIIVNGDIKIGATLITPKKSGVYPLVTIIHGGGDSDRKAPPIWFLGNYFATQGFACLIYDKRGCGETTGNWRTVDFNTRAGDISACIRWALKTDKKVDRKKVGAVAISQGTWISGLVALNLPEIDYLVNIAGPLSTVELADAYSIKNQLLKENYSVKDVEEQIDLWKVNNDVSRYPDQEEYWNTLVERIEFYKDRRWYIDSPYNPARKSWFRDWYKLVADFDPVPTLEKLNLPVLWLYGSRDTQSDLADNLAKLSMLKRDYHKDYSVEIFSDCGHSVMGPTDEWGNDLKPITTPKDFFPTIVRWIKNR